MSRKGQRVLSLFEVLSFLTVFITSFIQNVGYLGIFILMAMESTATPVPSELVMPFAGYLVGKGDFSFPIVVLVGSLGCLSGSLLSYCIGKYLGMPFINKFGKYVLVSKSDMKWAHDWFSRYGDKTIFLCRFVPVVRHVISFPAGMAGMNVIKFSIYTFAGSLIWVSFLAYLGYVAGENWEVIRNFTEKISLVVVVFLVVVVVVYIWRHLKARQ